jgi:F-type H+-transporting ATPase subunit epsilon
MADRSFNLEVVTPRARILHVESDDVTIPGITGELEAYPLHRPYLTALRPGRFSCQIDKEMRHFFVPGGYAEVLSGRIVILADECEELKEIDLEEARTRAKETQDALDEGRMLPEDEREPLQQKAEKARIRLQLAENLGDSGH